MKPPDEAPPGPAHRATAESRAVLERTLARLLAQALVREVRAEDAAVGTDDMPCRIVAPGVETKRPAGGYSDEA